MNAETDLLGQISHLIDQLTAGDTVVSESTRGPVIQLGGHGMTRAVVLAPKGPRINNLNN